MLCVEVPGRVSYLVCLLMCNALSYYRGDDDTKINVQLLSETLLLRIDLQNGLILSICLTYYVFVMQVSQF